MSENSQFGKRGEYLKQRLVEVRAAREQTQWLESFRLVTNYRIDATALLSRKKAAHAHELFYKQIKDGVEVVISEMNADQRMQLVNQIIHRIPVLPEKNAILLLSHQEFPGAVRLEIDIVLRMANRIWEFMWNEIALVNEDGTAGLLIETDYITNSGNHARDGFYSASAWGSFALLLRE
jgi:hypothetical protein